MIGPAEAVDEQATGRLQARPLVASTSALLSRTDAVSNRRSIVRRHVITTVSGTQFVESSQRLGPLALAERLESGHHTVGNHPDLEVAPLVRVSFGRGPVHFRDVQAHCALHERLDHDPNRIRSELDLGPQHPDVVVAVTAGAETEGRMVDPDEVWCEQGE